MKFYKNLYVSESLTDKKDEIIQKLKQKKIQFNCYIILLTENPENQLEFYDSLMLKQKNFKKDHLFVVGIAKGYDEALSVIKEITEDTYQAQHNADIRKFIINNEKQFNESRV